MLLEFELKMCCGMFIVSNPCYQRYVANYRKQQGIANRIEDMLMRGQDVDNFRTPVSGHITEETVLYVEEVVEEELPSMAELHQKQLQGPEDIVDDYPDNPGDEED